jgi:hypothetical protein
MNITNIQYTGLYNDYCKLLDYCYMARYSLDYGDYLDNADGLGYDDALGYEYYGFDELGSMLSVIGNVAGSIANFVGKVGSSVWKGIKYVPTLVKKAYNFVKTARITYPIRQVVKGGVWVGKQIYSAGKWLLTSPSQTAGTTPSQPVVTQQPPQQPVYSQPAIYPQPESYYEQQPQIISIPSEPVQYMPSQPETYYQQPQYQQPNYVYSQPQSELPPYSQYQPEIEPVSEVPEWTPLAIISGIGVLLLL